MKSESELKYTHISLKIENSSLKFSINFSSKLLVSDWNKFATNEKCFCGPCKVLRRGLVAMIVSSCAEISILFCRSYYFNQTSSFCSFCMTLFSWFERYTGQRNKWSCPLVFELSRMAIKWLTYSLITKRNVLYFKQILVVLQPKKSRVSLVKT